MKKVVQTGIIGSSEKSGATATNIGSRRGGSELRFERTRSSEIRRRCERTVDLHRISVIVTIVSINITAGSHLITQFVSLYFKFTPALKIDMFVKNV